MMPGDLLFCHLADIAPRIDWFYLNIIITIFKNRILLKSSPATS